jgi:hypothetical protein
LYASGALSLKSTLPLFEYASRKLLNQGVISTPHSSLKVSLALSLN